MRASNELLYTIPIPKKSSIRERTTQSRDLVTCYVSLCIDNSSLNMSQNLLII